MSATTSLAAPSRPAPGRVAAWWSGLGARDRVHLVAVALLVVGSIVHQLLYLNWYIEDSAISFAYARNLAHGDGLVAFAGGERCEGYSDPTWVALMALFQLVGVDGFVSSKILGVVFGALVVPLVYLIAREARPHKDDEVPLIAAVAISASAQAAIWNASGLENSLFNFLLAAGTWRTLVETRRGRWPLSAVFFLLLALTRPEGIAYGAIAGFAGMVWALSDQRGLGSTIAWLAAFFVPWGAYQVWHYEYFAWLFPNTYYAKMGEKDFRPFAWDGAGWKYIRNYARDVGAGWLLPVSIVGLVGWRRGRRALVVALSVALFLAVMYPFSDVLKGVVSLPQPPWVSDVRIWLLAGTAFLLPLTAIGRPGARALILSWYLGVAAVFFALWAGGDWMKGYRWMAMLAPTASVVFAIGVGELADALQWAFGREAREQWTAPGSLVGLVLVGAFIAPNVAESQYVLKKPETSPFQVQRRVNYMRWVQQRLFIDHVTDLDVDQGAHLWWSGFTMMDIAGLVDVPMAHHAYEKPFVKEYVFDEMKPHFAHVHGGWANKSRIPQNPEWKRDYFEIPGYPTSKTTLHVGNHIRKDLLIEPAWSGTPGRHVRFGDGIVLDGWDVAAPEAAQGHDLYVELGLESTRSRKGEDDDFRVMVFLASADGQHVASWSLPPGYDWLEPHEWERGEVFHGRFAVPVPDDLPPGDYDLGVVMLGPTGAAVGPDADQVDVDDDGNETVDKALPAGAVAGGSADVAALVANGEVRFPNAVRVVTEDDAVAASDADAKASADAASSGDCDGAVKRWNTARRRVVNQTDWIGSHQDAAGAAIARCYAELSKKADDPVAAMLQARKWDFEEPSVVAAGSALADTLYAQGLTARDKQDWETAYRRFADAVAVDPTRSWARRYAEEARDQRLGIRDGDDDADATPAAGKGDAQLKPPKPGAPRAGGPKPGTPGKPMPIPTPHLPPLRATKPATQPPPPTAP